MTIASVNPAGNVVPWRPQPAIASLRDAQARLASVSTENGWIEAIDFMEKQSPNAAFESVIAFMDRHASCTALESPAVRERLSLLLAPTDDGREREILKRLSGEDRLEFTSSEKVYWGAYGTGDLVRSCWMIDVTQGKSSEDRHLAARKIMTIPAQVDFPEREESSAARFSHYLMSQFGKDEAVVLRVPYQDVAEKVEARVVSYFVRRMGSTILDSAATIVRTGGSGFGLAWQILVVHGVTAEHTRLARKGSDACLDDVPSRIHRLPPHAFSKIASGLLEIVRSPTCNTALRVETIRMFSSQGRHRDVYAEATSMIDRLRLSPGQGEALAGFFVTMAGEASSTERAVSFLTPPRPPSWTEKLLSPIRRTPRKWPDNDEVSFAVKVLQGKNHPRCKELFESALRATTAKGDPWLSDTQKVIVAAALGPKNETAREVLDGLDLLAGDAGFFRCFHFYGASDAAHLARNLGRLVEMGGGNGYHAESLRKMVANAWTHPESDERSQRALLSAVLAVAMDRGTSPVLVADFCCKFLQSECVQNVQETSTRDVLLHRFLVLEDKLERRALTMKEHILLRGLAGVLGRAVPEYDHEI